MCCLIETAPSLLLSSKTWINTSLLTNRNLQTAPCFGCVSAVTCCHVPVKIFSVLNGSQEAFCSPFLRQNMTKFLPCDTGEQAILLEGSEAGETQVQRSQASKVLGLSWQSAQAVAPQSARASRVPRYPHLWWGAVAKPPSLGSEANLSPSPPACQHGTSAGILPVEHRGGSS